MVSELLGSNELNSSFPMNYYSGRTLFRSSYIYLSNRDGEKIRGNPTSSTQALSTKRYRLTCPGWILTQSIYIQDELNLQDYQEYHDS